MLPVLRHKHKGNYTIIPNDLLRDTRLSLKSIGLLCYLLQLPDGWEFSVAGLEKVLPRDGRESINRAVREICTAGYLMREQRRGDHGRLSSNDWVVSDLPEFAGWSPSTGFPLTEKPSAENPQQSKTESYKNVRIEIEDGREVVTFG